MLHARISIDAAVESRREPRQELWVEAPLRELGKTAVDARLLNISSRGFMAEVDELIRPGARVWLTLPGVGRANAVILWAKNGRVGGEFSQPLDPLIVIDASGRGRA